MANMSYCRFRNTLKDFDDCLQTLDDSGGIGNLELSPEEYKALRSLYILAKDFVELVDYCDEFLPEQSAA